MPDQPVAPVTVQGSERPGPILVLVDHATAHVPAGLMPGLGLRPEELARHIAYDIGALGLASRLGELLSAPVVASGFSRLVIDPNRGEDDPTLIMKLYDGTIIPGNRDVDAAERERRLTLYHRPYHAAIEAVAARIGSPVLVSIHSFTPRLRGRPLRPWEIGILFDRDRRLVDPLLQSLREDDIVTGENEPYVGSLPGDCMWQHGTMPGRAHVLVEIRQDLVEDTDGQAHWAERLAPHILSAVRVAGCA